MIVDDEQTDQSLKIEEVGTDGVGIGMTCWRDADRYPHRIYLILGDERLDLLISDEGSAEHSWPPSPPLQDIAAHQMDQQSALLGVGMAGSSHWSCSFCLSREPNIQLDCEMACLTKQDPIRMGNQYRVGRTAQMRDQAMCWPAGPEKTAILAAENREHYPTRLEVQPKAVHILPASTAPPDGRYRWQYRLRLVRN